MKFNFSLFRKKIATYIANKIELSELSAQEKGLVQGHREAISRLQRSVPDTQMVRPSDFGTSGDSGDSDVILYDFIQQVGNYGQPILISPNGNATTSTVGSVATTLIASSAPDGTEPQIVIKKIKPIDVWHELQGEPDPIKLENLDDKIKVLKYKAELIRTNAFARKEVIDMQMRLENRKKWNEFKEFYQEFDNTSIDKVGLGQ